MKYLEEYRSSEIVQKLLKKIENKVSGNYNLMEICGGQTHSLVKNGLIDLLPKGINMIHGPGCPVCVTPAAMIDKAIEIANKPNTILFTFGDMIRVPGTNKSLQAAQSENAEVKIVYSPLDAVKFAQSHPEIEVVFFAVGFETTAPANALSVLQAETLKLENYSILTSHVLVPPAMEAILTDEENKINGFLAAGHVCTVMGTNEYLPIASKYNVPIVVTGFEPVDLLNGIYALICQLEDGKHEVWNQYKRVVNNEGNLHAKKAISRVFKVSDREWRGIGTIPMSGYEVREEYDRFNAGVKFQLNRENVENITGCKAGDVLRGRIKPVECPLFRNVCHPENPLGAPMVSTEGACSAYYYFSDLTTKQNV